jgi:lysozyme family protein
MTFDLAFDRLLGPTHEGGYSDGAGDPGGESNWGISKRSYPHVTIATLTRDGAKAIYRRDFWTRIDADHLAAGVAFQLFDFAVNSGIETAVRALQRAVGVADDGYWGPISNAACAAMSESDLILRVNAERLDFMTYLSNWPTASRGWARRIAQNLRYGALDS